MSELVKFINNLIRNFTKSEVKEFENLCKDECRFTERQEEIFLLFYIYDKNREFIASKLGWSQPTIDKELKMIRTKVIKVIKYANKKQ